jgi:hypothetical protein
MAEEMQPLKEWRPDEQLFRWLEDIHFMKEYATSAGLSVPRATADKLAELTDEMERYRSEPKSEQAKSVGQMSAIVLETHSLFTGLVAPATPRSLRATPEIHGLAAWIRQYPFIVAMIVSICVGAGLFTAGIMNSSGLDKSNDLWTQLCWMGSAILGASFYSTFTAYRYLVSRTYDPQYTAVYMIRFLLGVVAGLILANFGKDFLSAGANGGIKLGGPTFALLGGYSSEAVNQILLRVTEVLVSAIKGGGDAQLQAKDEELKAAKVKSKAEQERVRTQIARDIEGVLSTTGSAIPEDLRKRIEELRKRVEHDQTP